MNIICTSCPMGCRLTYDNGNVTGNDCKRGINYAIAEMTNPVRNITTSVRVTGGNMTMLSVKTASPIPKSMIMDIVKEIHMISPKAPIAMGDVLIKDILNTGVNILATRQVDEKLNNSRYSVSTRH